MFPPPLAIPPQLAGRKQAALNFLAARSGLLICVLFALAGLALGGDYGMGLDEAYQRRTATANLEYILGQAERIDTFFDHDLVYGVAFELPLLLAERGLGLTDDYHIGRLRSTLTHLFFILGGYFCYRLAYRLFGSRLIAILALLIFLLHPRIYAHSYLNTKDLPFLSMFVLALYLLERAFRRDTRGAFLLLGIAVGLLTNLRIMGAMLVFAVIAMRGLDLFYAKTGPERKAILRTGGLFILMVALTMYALAPYAWTNPVGYLATSLNLTVNHPNVVSLLFQGERIFSDQLPPHYGVTWFGITTPPPIMLLGIVGIMAAAAGGWRRPGAVFRNTRQRFAGLLLAGLLLPPLAAALLGSNQFGDWRHSYFLYAPFCLLAAGGLGGVAAALARRPRLAAGVYGLAGLGLGLTALQLAQLHPVQYNYFNFLAERTAPEYLRTQYQLDYWQLAAKAALARLAEQHPGETLTVRAERRHRNILPPNLRRRLRPAAGHNADYDLTYHRDASQPDLAFNAEYRRSIYNNTLVVVRPLDAARMTASAIAAYREIYRQALADEPIIRADYNVYRQGNRLTFVKENCPPGEPDAWFGVRLFPHRSETLPAHLWRRGSYIPLGNSGVRLGDLCMAVIQLPDYAQGDLILMQRNLGSYRPRGRPLWSELYSLSQPGLRELIANYRRELSARPATEFRMSGNIPPAATEFGMSGNIPPAATEFGMSGKMPLSDPVPPLPNQPPPAGPIPPLPNQPPPAGPIPPLPNQPPPAGPIPPLPNQPPPAGPNPPILNQPPPAGPNPPIPNQPPAAGPNPLILNSVEGWAAGPGRAFEVFIDRDDGRNRLIYAKSDCTQSAYETRVTLHIYPVNLADLPAHRQGSSFDNRDFLPDFYGGRPGGDCVAVFPLPDYPIAALRTGQGGIWETNLYPPADPDYLRAAYAALSNIPPAARADFDLYLRDNRLVYVRESCVAADTEAGFFLHIIPQDIADLPAERQAAGFANRDFVFERWGGHFDGRCLAAIPLPDYPIAAIRTGQFAAGQGEVWAAEVAVDP